MCSLPPHNHPKFRAVARNKHERGSGSCLPFQQMHPWEQFKYHISALFCTQSGVESNCWFCIKGGGYGGRIALLILRFSLAHEPRKDYCLLPTPDDLTLQDIFELHFFQHLSDFAFWQAVLAESWCVSDIVLGHGFLGKEKQASLLPGCLSSVSGFM